ncbi:nitrilase [Geosporobacter ferrireducens]|uniref:Nitrilase n=2 Tax=Geosporobacter ferrireducens TaxID=1424294 RepID=A0A1D8GQL5_9FIRM|nr:nitrilase [Geosporobacter ferrireducens]
MEDSTMTFKAAAVQFNPQLNERDQNIEGLLEVVIEAAKQDAKLIVTPEMATTGYYYANRDAIAPFVDTIPGYTTKKFEEVAKKYDIYIVIGMPEVDPETELYYNAAALVGPEGYIGKYRKTHQWETEEHWAAWGDLGVPVYDTKIGKIAMNICMDSAYFESARLAAVNGADILAFPTNSSAQAIAALQARAIQNGLYIVSANRSNTENGFHMIGASAIWSPEGKKLAEAAFVPSPNEDIHESTIIYGEIDRMQYNNQGKKRLKERRPELYKDLMLYIAPWDYSKNNDSHDITAAVIQYEPVIGNKDENLDKISTLLQKSLQEGKQKGKAVQLVVLPELSATGPIKELDTIKNAAEDLDGTTVKFFEKIAKENHLHIVFGMIEKEGDKLYNSAVLVGPKGEVIGSYRQAHLNETDKTWATPGNALKVFSTDIGKIGVMIGYDAAFPEVAGIMAVRRADIIAMPARWNGIFDREIEMNPNISANKYPAGAMSLWDSVAMSAQAYTIVSNLIGTDSNYFGQSGLYTLDPLYGLDQPLAARKNQEDLLLMDIKTLQNDWWFNQQRLIESRRTYFYKPLIQSAK